MRLLLCSIAICTVPMQHCCALTFRSPERLTASAIVSWSEMYQSEHEGALPKTWNDFKGILEEPIEETMRHSVPVKRYAFISPPITLPEPHSGELVAINRRAIYDTTLSQGILGLTVGLRGPGRYIIYRNPDRHLTFAWVAEDYVLGAFAAAATNLPDPDNEPERVWVKKARRSIYYWRAIYCVIPLLIAATFLWRRCVRLNIVES